MTAVHPNTPVCWEHDYRLEDRQLHGAFVAGLDPVLEDFIDIAVAASIKDRSVLRSPPGQWDGYRRGWRRHTTLDVPVRCVDVWHRESVRCRLVDTLQWLTDDSWDIHLYSGPPLRRSPSQRPLFPIASGRSMDVVLFSGGLDSVAGAAHLLLAQPSRSVVGVSVCTNPAMRSYQESCARVLNDACPGRFVHLLVVAQRVRPSAAEERSRRSRALLFYATGIAVAASAGQDMLRVHENGVGAINVGYLRTQVGSQTTRAVHPRTLYLVSDLASHLLGRPFQVHNPNLRDTKAEMCARVRGFQEALEKSESCDLSTAHRGPDKRCGECTSCLLRRQSLHAAGLVDVDLSKPWAHDVLRQEDPRRLNALRAMLTQAARFDAALTSANPIGALVEEFPDLVDIPPPARTR